MTRRDPTPKILLATMAVFAVIVVVLLVMDEQRLARRSSATVEFQQLVGGLGTGPSTTRQACGHSFDLRVGEHCQCDEGPLFGQTHFCPHESMSIFSLTRPRHPEQEE